MLTVPSGLGLEFPTSPAFPDVVLCETYMDFLSVAEEGLAALWQGWSPSLPPALFVLGLFSGFLGLPPLGV